mgnify:CR=1 FL=1
MTYELIVNTALVIMYLTSLGLVLSFKRRLRSYNYVVRLRSLARSRLRKLGSTLHRHFSSYDLISRLTSMARDGYLVLIYIITLMFLVCVFTKDYLITMGLAVFLLSTTLLSTANVKGVKVRRFVKRLGRYLWEVHLEVKNRGFYEVSICERVKDDVVIVKGDICRSITDSEDVVRYVALSTHAPYEGYVIIHVKYPASMLSKVLMFKPPTHLKDTEVSAEEFIEGLGRRYVVSIREPSVEGVRGYAPGDELRLVDMRKLGMLDGLRTKLLSREVDEQTVFTDKVCVSVGDYVTKYIGGRNQLKYLLHVLAKEGIRYVVTNQGDIDIDEFIKNIERYLGSTASRRCELMVVSPDKLSEVKDLIRKSTLRPLIVIIMEPIEDKVITNYIGSKAALRTYGEWVKGLRKDVDNSLKELSELGIKVIVFELGY